MYNATTICGLTNPGQGLRIDHVGRIPETADFR